MRRYCPRKAKESSTLYTDKIHMGRLKRLLGDQSVPQTYTLTVLQQNYVNKRAKEQGRRGQPVRADTIKQEMATLRKMWRRGLKHGWVQGAFPGDGLAYPKTKEKEPFQTRAEIERRIRRGGLTDVEIQELWDSLYLSLAEVDEVLAHVRKSMPAGPCYPMFCVAAYTGARRSEILRLQVDDFDFDAGVVRIREKKNQQPTTFRHVTLAAKLATATQVWLGDHPGGSLAMCVTATSARTVTGVISLFCMDGDETGFRTDLLASRTTIFLKARSRP